MAKAKVRTFVLLPGAGHHVEHDGRIIRTPNVPFESEWNLTKMFRTKFRETDETVDDEFKMRSSQKGKKAKGEESENESPNDENAQENDDADGGLDESEFEVAYGKNANEGFKIPEAITEQVLVTKLGKKYFVFDKGSMSAPIEGGAQLTKAAAQKFVNELDAPDEDEDEDDE